MNIPNESITMDEAEVLVDGIAARDQRTTDVADALAWWTDLNRAQVRYPDAADAVSRYYTEIWPRQDPKQRFRATPPVIIELVREIRKARLDQANLAYVPGDPEESGAEFVARKQAQIKSVANGGTVPQQACVLSPRPVAALVAGIADAKALPAEIAQMLAPRRTGPRSVRCPVCSADPAAHCVGGGGRSMSSPHPTRTDAWAVLAVGCPECRADAGDGCRQLGHPYEGGAHPGRVSAAIHANRAEKDES